MGEVYLARAPSGELRALKLVRTDRAASPQATARFRREVLALEALRHPGIVQILDAGQAPGGALYLAMEYVAGPDLAAAVEPAARSRCADALAILARVASALASAHGAGIVHRDLKPANVVLADGDPAQAKIIDFGLAKIVADEGLTLTDEAQVLGSPGYWAPEQSQTAKVGPAADVYALGALAYFVVSGRPMFRARPAVAMIYAHAHETPEPLANRAARPGRARRARARVPREGRGGSAGDRRRGGRAAPAVGGVAGQRRAAAGARAGRAVAAEDRATARRSRTSSATCCSTSRRRSSGRSTTSSASRTSCPSSSSSSRWRPRRAPDRRGRAARQRMLEVAFGVLHDDVDARRDRRARRRARALRRARRARREVSRSDERRSAPSSTRPTTRPPRTSRRQLELAPGLRIEQVRADPRARPRRHGPGVPRARHQARPARRDEVPRRARQAVQRSLQVRGPRRPRP